MAVKRIRKIRQSTSTLSSTASVIDSLTSTSKTDALSANQGKILNNTKLSLTGGTITSGLSLRVDTVDMTKTNNNVTTDIFPSTFNVIDKNNKIMTRLEGIPQSTGTMNSYWYVRNYKTDGTMLGQSGIKLIMEKTGAFHTNIEGDLYLTGQNMISINGHKGIIQHGANDTQLTASSGNIYLRPYGYNNRDNEVTIGTECMYAKIRPIPRSVCGNDNTGGNGWYKICSGSINNFGNTKLVLMVSDNYYQRSFGILNIEIRGNNGSLQCWDLRWMTRSPGISYNDAGIVISGTNWTLYINRHAGQYGRLTCTELIHYNINGGTPPTVTYYNSTTKESTTPSFTVTSYDNTGLNHPITLYNNTSGNTGTVTLSDSWGNYSYLEIFTIDENNELIKCTKVVNLGNKSSINVCCSVMQPWNDNSNFALKGALYTLSGTTMTKKGCNYGTLTNASSVITSQNSGVIKVVRVLGYK